MRQLLTVNDLCELLGVSRTTVWRLARRGELPTVKIGRLVRFRPADVTALIDRENDDGPAGSPGAATDTGEGTARDERS